MPETKKAAKKFTDGEIRDLYDELERVKLEAAGKAVNNSAKVADLKRRIREAEAQR
jgi:hypothetical protein